MGKNKGKGFHQMPIRKQQAPQKKISATLLDKMVDGREFESLLKFQYEKLQVVEEIRKSLKEVQDIRKKPLICYIANVVKPKNAPVSIDDSDDLPFNEMIRSLPDNIKEVDIALVTPGGFAHQIAKFVNTLRPRFEKVNFILLNKAMSAGTIFALSGDEIVMAKQSQIGPIDPQVRNRIGEFVPAQAILTLIEEIRERGEIAIKKGQQPTWTDIQILNNIDPKEIGNAISASKYSIQLVEEYLYKFKFKNWEKHSTSGLDVTDKEKKEKSKRIAELLCNHGEWKIHGHAITRDAAWNVCKLQTTHSESIDGLDRAMRRMWAMFYWLFENTTFTKIFISDNYCIIRSDTSNSKKK